MPILDEFKYDNLFAGDYPIVTDTVMLGDDYERGTVLGIITDSDKAVAVDSSSENGSETAYAVLAEDAESDTEATVYLTGEFNTKALAFGGDDNAEKHKQALRKIGIFLKENV